MPRRYPALTIDELADKLCAEQRCSKEEVHKVIDGKAYHGYVLRKPSDVRKPYEYPILPDRHDVPLTDYTIRLVCQGLGLDADIVFKLVN
jgi:hypothetical protein